MLALQAHSNEVFELDRRICFSYCWGSLGFQANLDSSSFRSFDRRMSAQERQADGAPPPEPENLLNFSQEVGPLYHLAEESVKKFLV